jgi:hypothetical protein
MSNKKTNQTELKATETKPDTQEWLHKDGLCSNPIQGTQKIFAFIGYKDISYLEGKILTIIDATLADKDQRSAAKDIIRQTIRGWANDLDRYNDRVIT